jgi:hypothetical protein
VVTLLQEVHKNYSGSQFPDNDLRWRPEKWGTENEWTETQDFQQSIQGKGSDRSDSQGQNSQRDSPGVWGSSHAQVNLWKKELQEQFETLFAGGRGPKPVDQTTSSDRLYAEIGRLKMKLDWLKKSGLM